MEKYYIAGFETDLYREYLAYLENQLEIREVVAPFFEKHGITANEYLAGTANLWIVSTAADMEKFADQLSKNANPRGLRFFKIKSEIRRLWTEEVKATGLQIIQKPILRRWFPATFQLTSRVFMYQGLLYIWVNSDCNFPNPEGFAEIKASKYYEALEGYTDGE